MYPGRGRLESRKGLLPILPARGAPTHPGEGSVRGPVTSARTPGQASPTAGEVWQGEAPRQSPARAGSGRPAGRSLPGFTTGNRPRAEVSRAPAPPAAPGKGVLPGQLQRQQLLQRVEGGGVAQGGGKGKKVRRPNKEPEGGGARPRPSGPSQAPHKPSPAASAVPTRTSMSERAVGGRGLPAGGRGQKSSPSGPDDTRPPTDAPAPHSCHPEKRRPREPPRPNAECAEKWRSPSLLAPSIHPTVAFPPPGSGSSGSGAESSAHPSPEREQRKTHDPGWVPLTVPEARLRRPTASPAVPTGRGAAGASGPVSEAGDPPPQRCPQTRIRPFPPAAAASASLQRLHAAPRALPPAGTQRPLRTRHRASSAAAADAAANPLFLFCVFDAPTRAGLVSPRGGTRRFLNRF
ncbi:basic salivary proline-rich protein 1-like [Dasypus novemcinctus]|uniref:basic salivary proline-rich protein 1-like n=1 Tax=Dasypus novemcinctus TaxID=9361 RepID=UPI00265FB39E|nr:proline-rich protein 36-like [Dasypus novemcinctus]